jgi:predicted enzyme related to lactoylglutathione lyase
MEGSMGHPVVHFQIGAVDDAAAAKFYAEVFGWTMTPVPTMPYHTAHTGSPIGIQGGIAKVEKESDAVVTIYVEVPEVAEILSLAESLGAKVIMPATAVMPTLTLGMFVDPAGRVIGLSHDTSPATLAAAKTASKKEVKSKAKKKEKKKDKKKGKTKKKKGKK